MLDTILALERSGKIKMESTELMHYGVKGMKWGVRKKRAPDHLNYPNKSSATTRRVIDDYNSMSDQEFKNKYSGSKKTYAKRIARYGDPYMNAPLAKMGKKLEAKQKAKRDHKKTHKNLKKTMVKGAETTAKVLSKVGQAYITDQIFWGGMGTKIVKETVKAMGMATITAYTMARGGYDIKWYDKQGRRVG